MKSPRNESGEELAPLPTRLRLDVFLKWSGLVRRRTLAKWMCERGSIRVNGQVAKAGRFVGVGDRLEILRARDRLKVEIVQLPAHLLGRRAAGPEPSPSRCFRLTSEAESEAPEKTSA